MNCHFFSYSPRRPVIRAKALLAIAALLATSLWHAVSVNADTPRAESVQEIIGGVDSAPKTPSWMVALIRKSSSADTPTKRLQFCGGVLVSDEWILTAAHCVLRITAENTTVVIGEYDIDAAEVEQRELSQIVVHPNYNTRTFENDVAMLKLKVPTLQEPVSIFDDSANTGLAGQAATVLGWGQTYVSPERCEPVFADSQVNPDDFNCRVHDFQRASRQFQGRLLHANITILSDAECNARILKLLESLGIEGEGIDENADFTPPNQLCAYDPAEKKGICFGDSGGPITVEQNGREVLLGTASLVYGTGGCARDFAVDVFTLSAPFAGFMDDVMHRDYSLSFESFCPQPVSPMVAYEEADESGTLTRINWSVAEPVESYILRYSDASSAQDQITTLELDGDFTEISARLEPGSSFYVSIQAKNESCTGPVSEVLEIMVPLL